MRLEKARQWVGAVYAEDLELMREMLAEDRSLADSLHPEFDDPFRKRRFPVATLLFAVNGPPQQQFNWRIVKRAINFDMVKLLVESGADVNISSVHGVPLCHVRDETIARYLIEHGADPDYWHENGGSPLFFAVWQADPRRLRMLLDLGADPHRTNPDTGESALHTAVLSAGNSFWAGKSGDDIEVLQCLLAAGVDPNQKTKAGVRSSNWHTPRLAGDTALHLAAAYVHADLLEPIVEALITWGADTSLRNAAGKSPYDLAVEQGRAHAILEMLSQHDRALGSRGSPALRPG